MVVRNNGTKMKDVRVRGKTNKHKIENHLHCSRIAPGESILLVILCWFGVSLFKAFCRIPVNKSENNLKYI